MFRKTFSDKVFLKTLTTLALPIVLQNLISFSVSMTDTVMLGFVGQGEMAAATLANAFFFVVGLMIFGFQSGESVLISQYWGKQDKKSISRILGIAWACVLAITLSVAAFAIIAPQAVMRIFSNETHIIEMGARYVRAVAIAYPLNAFTSIYVSAHRSMENPKLGLFVFASSAIINVVFNYVFIFGEFGFPKLGVVGAAVGTVSARIIEFTIVMVYIFVNKVFKIDFKALFKPGKDMVKDFFRYATPVIFNETMWGMGFSSLSAIYGRMGSDVVAAITICRNIESVLNVVSLGIGNAAVVIIGTQLGRGDTKTVMETAKKLLVVTGCASLFSATMILILANPVIHLFDFSETTNALAFAAICIYAARMVPMNVNMTAIVGVLRGGGDTRTAMLIDVLPLWLVTVPLAALFGLVLKLPPVFAFTPNFIEDCIKTVISFKRLKSGLWINNITRGA